MSGMPIRLLRHLGDGQFDVFDPRPYPVQFDIVSYTWGPTIPAYTCDIAGVTWGIILKPEKLDEIKRLMITANIQHLWVDCVCINQGDETEKAVEVTKMFEYYKTARQCHILLEMPEVWDPQRIVDDLKFVDHVLSHMDGAALTSEAMITPYVRQRLNEWAAKPWTFPVDQETVKAAAIDMGLLNCYSTCVNHVRSLFRNLYFSRVWTFQELILGKRVAMWAINPERISPIGELFHWIDLATDSKDKAYKLQAWIENSRVLKTGAVSAITRFIEEDNTILRVLQLQVLGIHSAKTDIINGGPNWWYENYKGVSNIFSAISIMPRECTVKADLYRGLLGIFNGLFTAEEVARDMSGDDMEKISFNFFRQLSVKTGFAWTKLAISSGERGEWDWIPMVENSSSIRTTDCFAGVVRLGRLKQKDEKGWARAQARTGIKGNPRKYMTIHVTRQSGPPGFQFIFKGCNCGKKVSTGLFGSEPIPTHDQPRNIVRDETGRSLVQAATILGSLFDPSFSLVDFRRRLLGKLQPDWHVSDLTAKPLGWVDRCVSGTFWEHAPSNYVRVHNLSMNWNMVDIYDCESRLWNDSTKNLTCEVRVNCGCTVVAPFAFIFEGITACQESFLGDVSAELDDDNRIILHDGLGLVQVGDVGRTFNLVAFGGDVQAHKTYATQCRRAKVDKEVVPQKPWPTGRALVREDFKHDMMDGMRDYGYVDTGGSGNLLIMRSHPVDPYRIIGVCIDEWIQTEKKEVKSVLIR
ncbi:uncharacterized protein EI97DRAFT_432226 [Westerdykella ornata]|uniref:Heterokaryon incompatibility domain-containing protein n=1 Tax=Westerdykella ornata TaxID=318751 RepID=A0A6A6JLG8_WESOR|nr:uncharacterized protein EI97DRAFT_432226 [Westerdykella ornata]KAF2277347.1 hypothetical protein EI97DRAFT_432226 [Westerdykella ornata]